MKAARALSIILIVVLGIPLPMIGRSQTVDSVQEHRALAQWYEDQLTVIGFLAEEHKQEKAAYEKQSNTFTRAGDALSIGLPHEELIARDEALATELRKMAEWHRAHAEGLERV